MTEYINIVNGAKVGKKVYDLLPESAKKNLREIEPAELPQVVKDLLVNAELKKRGRKKKEHDNN